MNNAKHTPGPWIIRYAKNITAIGTPKGEMQLSLHGVYNGLKPLSVDLHEWKANAALIAAAPAMYEALKHAAMSHHHPACKAKGEYTAQPERYCSCHVQKARAALAQAEGKL